MSLGSRKANAVMLVLLLLAGTAVSFGPAMYGSRRIGSFCRGIARGARRADVVSRAGQEKFNLTGPSPDALVIEHPSSLGRAYCVVHFDAESSVTSVVVGD